MICMSLSLPLAFIPSLFHYIHMYAIIAFAIRILNHVDKMRAEKPNAIPCSHQMGRDTGLEEVRGKRRTGKCLFWCYALFCWNFMHNLFHQISWNIALFPRSIPHNFTFEFYILVVRTLNWLKQDCARPHLCALSSCEQQIVLLNNRLMIESLKFAAKICFILCF